jgi:hypothetical protein
MSGPNRFVHRTIIVVHTTAQAWRASASSASGPKLEIDAGLDFLHVQRCVARISREIDGRQIDGLIAEAEIIVFDPGRPVRRQRIFEAGAGGPAGAREV